MPEDWSQHVLENIDAAKSTPEGRIRWMTGLKVAVAMIGILLGCSILWLRYGKKKTDYRRRIPLFWPTPARILP